MICNTCKIEKPLSEMVPRRDRPCGFSKQCKACNRAKSLAWGRNHQERTRERAKEWRSKNIEYARKRDKERSKDERRRVGSRASAKARYARQRAEMLAAYGGKCVCCGETEGRFLTLEHIFHDGSQHRASKGPNQIVSDLRRLGWPKDRYTLLCMNCNWSERNGGPCPHKAGPKFIVVG